MLSRTIPASRSLLISLMLEPHLPEIDINDLQLEVSRKQTLNLFTHLFEFHNFDDLINEVYRKFYYKLRYPYQKKLILFAIYEILSLEK